METPLTETCRTTIFHGLSILDATGWNFLTNLSSTSVRLIVVFLAGASVLQVPPDAVSVLFVSSGVPDCSPRISKTLSETSSSSSPSHSLSSSDRDSVTVVECAGSVISVNDSEPSSAGAAGVFNDEVRMFRHVHTQCHTIARASLHARFWASSLGTPT